MNDLNDKRLIFALLAHKDEHVLAAQLDNISHFNPNAGIVLYNGGTDPDFAKSLNVTICPYSRPIQYANQSRFFLDVMRWLEETKVEYEYLVNLDHDVLFVKHGFEPFLDETMKSFDCMGWELIANYSPDDFFGSGEGFVPVIRSMWNEWHDWRPVFGTDTFLRYFNPTQVYRHDLVKRMLSHIDVPRVEQLFDKFRVSALEEMFFVTLAMACGGKCRVYPTGQRLNDAVRWTPDISIEEAYRAIHHPYHYWIHPVKGDWLVTVSRWLRSGAVLPQQEPEKQTQKEREEKSKKRRKPRKRKAVMSTKRVVSGKRTNLAKKVKNKKKKAASPIRKLPRSNAGKEAGMKKQKLLRKRALRRMKRAA